MIRFASLSASSISTIPLAGFFQPSSRACWINEEACSKPEFFERNSSILASAFSNSLTNFFLSSWRSSFAIKSGKTAEIQATANTPAIVKSIFREITIAIPKAVPAKPENARNLLVESEPDKAVRQCRRRVEATIIKILDAMALSPSPNESIAMATTIGQAIPLAMAILERSTGPWSIRSISIRAATNIAITGPILGKSSTLPSIAGNNHQPAEVISNKVPAIATFSTLERCWAITRSAWSGGRTITLHQSV